MKKIKLKYHYKPKKNWLNDPNGLIEYNGEYHLFYQHTKDSEAPSLMGWGHATTKDFTTYKELPMAIYPEHGYEAGGCWSGTAIEKDGVLYLFYASVIRKHNEEFGDYYEQTVSIAYSYDGEHFTKYNKNPVIKELPEGLVQDFRDPAVFSYNGKYYMLIASANAQRTVAKMHIYESQDLFNWQYNGVLFKKEHCKFFECPSIVEKNGRVMISCSVVGEEENYFYVMTGTFNGKSFIKENEGRFQHGPDEYAGQLFKDKKGRVILISWIGGWHFASFSSKCIGALSIPLEITEDGGKIKAYPIKELQHLLKNKCSSVSKTNGGFIIKRQLREDVIINTDKNDVEFIKDDYILEIFINKGEETFKVILC